MLGPSALATINDIDVLKMTNPASINAVPRLLYFSLAITKIDERANGIMMINVVIHNCGALLPNGKLPPVADSVSKISIPKIT